MARLIADLAIVVPEAFNPTDLLNQSPENPDQLVLC
jgi:hypothetical protein